MFIMPPSPMWRRIGGEVKSIFQSDIKQNFNLQICYVNNEMMFGYTHVVGYVVELAKILLGIRIKHILRRENNIFLLPL